MRRTREERVVERNEKIDGIKAVLIFLMVLGHMSYNDFHLHLTRMIYSFHMPAFVFLSGYFTSLKSDTNKRIKWVCATLAIYIVGQWAQCLYGAVLPFLTHGEFGPIHWKSVLGLSPCWTMWYILSLVYWRIGIWVFHGKVKDGPMLIMSCVVAALSGCVPIGNQLSFQRTFVFMPMFIMGYLFKKNSYSIGVEKCPLWICAVVLSIGFALAWYLPTFAPSGFYACVGHDLPKRVFQCLLAVGLTFSVIRVLYLLPMDKLARWGRYTLWVYIGHAVPMLFQRAVLHKCGIHLNVFSAIPLAVCYVVGLTLLGELYYSAAKRLKS